MEDKILYHGSREGIIGDIRPESRGECDFGKGFYMGEDQNQARSLVVNGTNPMLYKVKFKLSEIPDSKILVLDNDTEWLYAVLANRRLSKEFDRLKLAKQWQNKLGKYDVVIGKIADDKMKYAINQFSRNSITDRTLLAYLQSVDYGMQYVAKSEFACSKIERLSEKKIFGLETQQASDYAKYKMREFFDNIGEINYQYRDQGLFLKDIIRKESLREKKGVMEK